MGKSLPGVDIDAVELGTDGLSSAVSIYRSGDATTGIGLTTTAISHYIAGTQTFQSSSSGTTLSKLSLTGTGGILSTTATVYVAPSLVTTNTNAAYFTYLNAPSVSGSFIPSAAYTLYVAGAPSIGTSKYALYVATDASGFAGQILGSSSTNLSTPAHSFIGDASTGIGYSTTGAYNLVSSGALIAGISSTGLSIASTKAINFGGEVTINRAGTSHFVLDSTGLATIANGYAGNVTTATVSLARGTLSQTSFPAGPVTANIDYFPLGGKTYYVQITYTGWAIIATYSSGLLRMNITFTPFTTVDSANLIGLFASNAPAPSATTVNVHLECRSMLRTAPNVITMETSASSGLSGGHTWRNNNTLTVYVHGTIIADK